MNVRKAFEDAYRSHKERLLTLATALTGDRGRAEDIVHDVFASLIEEPGRLRNSKNLLGFLAVCARNRAYDLYRKTKRQDQHTSEIGMVQSDSNPGDPAKQLEKHDEQQVLLGMVNQLPNSLREVVSLRIWGDLTFGEIAELQDTTKSTAHERYRRALEELRTQFAKRR